MAGFEDVLAWTEQALVWLDTIANELLVGLIVALALTVWVWKGRDGQEATAHADPRLDAPEREHGACVR